MMTKAEAEAIHQLVRMSLEWVELVEEQGPDYVGPGHKMTNAQGLRNMIQSIDQMAQEASKHE